MKDLDIHRFASTLAEIAHALEHDDTTAFRIKRVLELTKELVPYARIALLDTEEKHQHLHLVPAADPGVVESVTAALRHAWRKMVEEVGEPGGAATPTPGLTLPVMGLDRINGILRVDPMPGFEYDATHLRLLSVVGAQLGAYLTMTRLRAEQARHNAELATAIEFQQILAAVVGHDLRSPLAVIITVASMLRETATEPNQLRALDRALSSAHRASRLITDLIDVTECRVQGAMPIRRRRTDARRIVEDAVEEARVAHPRCAIELDIFGNEVVFGQWDPERLGEVLINLISNAVHHGDPKCAVRVTMAHDDISLRLTVHNSGPPIPEYMLPTIFDPFKRGASEQSVRKHGLGLGLYIVEQIVSAHRGTVSVSSSAEHGTTFTIKLPRDATVTPAQLMTSQLVLVVDDDEDVRIGVQGLLEKRGFQVAQAVDGQDALEQLRRGLRPSAILLDLHMPRMDGATFCARCTDDPELAKIPIIVVSSDAASALELSRAGSFLPKPVRGSELLRALDDLSRIDRT